MHKEFILGFCEDEILIGCASTDSGYFSFSTTSYNLIDIEKGLTENALDYITSYLEDGAEYHIQSFLANYFKDIEEIAKDILNNMNTSEILDFVYPDVEYSVGELYINDNTYMLNSIGWGQIDIKDYINFNDKDKKLNDTIYKFWEKYHLTNTEEIPKNELIELFEMLENVEYYADEIEDYINNNFDNLVIN